MRATAGKIFGPPPPKVEANAKGVAHDARVQDAAPASKQTTNKQTISFRANKQT
jgi:hypothetical protein